MAEFVPTTWNDDDDVTPQKLNQMAQNDDYLLSRAVPTLYKAHGINKETGIKVAAGVVPAPVISHRQTTVTVNFEGYFSSGCSPVVLVTGLCTDKWRAFYVVTGLAQGTLLPTEQGFRVIISEMTMTAENMIGYLERPTSVSWLAIGY